MATYELLSADIRYIDQEGHLIRTEEKALNHIVKAEPVNWQFDTVNQVLFYNVRASESIVGNTFKRPKKA